MNTLTLLIVSSIAVSIDGFACGIACGCKNGRIRAKELCVMSAFPLAGSTISMEFAQLLRDVLTPRAANILSFLLLITLAIFAALDAFNSRKTDTPKGALELRDAILVGMFVAIDASMTAFSVGLAKGFMPIVPILYAGTHGLFLEMGSIAGGRGKAKKADGVIKYVPCLLFCLMAMTKIL